MSKRAQIITIVIAVPVVLVGLMFVHQYVYPIFPVNPNFSDVEKAFAKLQFPSDWQEISSSENRGLHGRGCDPLNDSGCFHKSKTFKLPEGNTLDNIKTVITASGLCSDLVISSPLYKDQEIPTNNYECGAGDGLSIGGTYRGPDNEVSITVRTY